MSRIVLKLSGEALAGDKGTGFSEKKVKSSKKILDLLKVHPEYSATRIASEIGISAKAVEKHLAKFKAAGILVREGPDKGGRWIVKEG